MVIPFHLIRSYNTIVPIAFTVGLYIEQSWDILNIYVYIHVCTPAGLNLSTNLYSLGADTLVFKCKS